MKSKNNTVPNKEASTLGLLVWWLFLILSILASIYLCYVCIFGSSSVLAQSNADSTNTAATNQTITDASKPSPSPLGSPQSNPASAQADILPNSSPIRNKEAEHEGRINEMSKRIEEIGNHSTRILQVIGILIGFITIVVAIGLWNAKQYVDRAAEHAKTDLEAFIKEETRKQLDELKSAVDNEFQKTMANKILELNEHGMAALKSLERYHDKAISNLKSQSESRIESYLRVGIPLIERLQQILNKALELAYERQLISPEGRDASKKELERVIWIQIQVTRALAQLESIDEELVIAGSQTLSALGDRTCLPALEMARLRWSDKPRVVEQLSACHQKLLSSE
jgi:hypothetical protein